MVAARILRVENLDHTLFNQEMEILKLLNTSGREPGLDRRHIGIVGQIKREIVHHDEKLHHADAQILLG